MSILGEITRLQGIRNALRTKLTALDVISKADASFSELQTAVDGISDNGAVAGTISTKTGKYNVPEGYHNGGGAVQIASAEQNKLIPDNIKFGIQILGVEGTYEGAGAKLQTKSVTPSKSAQNVTADAGYDGLSAVNVLAIPDAYAVVNNVTAAPADVRASKIFVDADGVERAGTMVDNGAVSATIDGLTTTSYTVPAGCHSGTGTVSLTGDIEAALAAL